MCKTLGSLSSPLAPTEHTELISLLTHSIPSPQAARFQVAPSTICNADLRQLRRTSLKVMEVSSSVVCACKYLIVLCPRRRPLPRFARPFFVVADSWWLIWCSCFLVGVASRFEVLPARCLFCFESAANRFRFRQRRYRRHTTPPPPDYRRGSGGREGPPPPRC